MRPEFDHVVAFEAVDTSAPQIYFRGEIEFHSLGLPLDERIRDAIRRFEQKAVAYKQAGIRAIARKLWKFRDDGTRQPIDLPAAMAEEDLKWEERKRSAWNNISIDYSSPFY
jgi:hypothetical protein